MKNDQPILYVKIFLIVLLLATCFSIVYKSINLINNSSYKHNSFNLLILNRDAELIHFDSSSHKLLIVKMSFARQKLLGLNRLGQSAYLGVLIDGSLIQKNGTSDPPSINDFMTSSFASSLIFTGGGYSFNNLNSFDIMKFLFESKLIPKDSREEQAAGSEQDLQDLMRGDLLNSFADQKILTERASVEVINGTEIDGFGNQVSNALKSAGYNVVELSTSDLETSSIRGGGNFPESLGRLRDTFKIIVQKNDTSNISDITLVLGKDILKK